jgi:acetyl esterase/lipase
MMYKILKKFLLVLSMLLALMILLILTPRIWSALNPGKPPMGYYFLAPTVLAVYTGIESLAEKTPKVPDNVEVAKNIEYKNCNGKSLQMDIYQAKNSSKPAPMLVFIHGGGWSHGDRNEYLGYALYFANLGYTTATLTYRVVKDAPYPACVADVTDAVAFIFRNSGKYHFDHDRVALVGGSAGSHLAMLAAYGWRRPGSGMDTMSTAVVSHRIKAVVEMYGPVDFTTEYARKQSMVTRLMGHSYQEIPQLYAEASPINWVDKNAPPSLILQGTRDMLVPLSQAELLKRKLDSLGIACIYRPLPGWPHTMDLVKRVNDYFKVTMLEFFEQYVQ